MVHPLSSSLIQRMLSPRIGNNMAGTSREDENSFWRFPGEIRNETYGYWISCGDLSMMTTNGKIYLEMLQLVLEQTSYRLVRHVCLEERLGKRLNDWKYSRDCWVFIM